MVFRILLSILIGSASVAHADEVDSFLRKNIENSIKAIVKKLKTERQTTQQLIEASQSVKMAEEVLSLKSSNTPKDLIISGMPNKHLGAVAIGSKSSIKFFIFNNSPYAISDLAAAGMYGSFGFTQGSFPGSGGNCGTTLKPQEYCTISISFSPFTTGEITTSLTVLYRSNGQQQSKSISLSGLGVAKALLRSKGQPAYHFGVIPAGGVSERYIEIENTGGIVAIKIAGPVLSSPFRFTGGMYPGRGGTCTETLSPGASCKLAIEFSPVTIGLFSELLSISYYNGAAEALSSIALEGISQ